MSEKEFAMYMSFDSASLIVTIIACVIFACVVVAYFLSISMMVHSALEKGCPWSKGRLWFIGIFTTPITLGVIVAGLPDRK